MSGIPGGWRRLLTEVPVALGRRLGPASPPPHPPRWWAWRHVVKLDPDRTLSEGTLATVLSSGTDAVVVGGTQGITSAKVLALLTRLRNSPCPVALEVSDPAATVPAVDQYFIPLVLNSPNSRWIAGDHADALTALWPRYSTLIPWERMWPVAYLVQNSDSAVALRTGAKPVTRAQVSGFSAMVGRLWRLPLMYVEYSGRYGDPALVAEARRAAGPQCHIWYGGGISTTEQAAAMARAAHTVVVGNLVYQVPERIVATVLAVRSTPTPP